MNITLQTSGMRLTDNLREFATQKMEDTLKVFGQVDPETLRMEILLSRHEEQGETFRARANVTMPGDHFYIEEEADDIKKAVTRLKQSITKRMRRQREKLVDKHQKAAN